MEFLRQTCNILKYPSNFKRTFCKQKLQNLIRRCILAPDQELHCLPTLRKTMLVIYGLNQLTINETLSTATHATETLTTTAPGYLTKATRQF